jgi:hypothetical protein
MNIVEKRFAGRQVDSAADGDMSGTISICIGLVAALVIYALGSALLLQGVGASAAQTKVPAEMSFLGP